MLFRHIEKVMLLLVTAKKPKLAIAFFFKIKTKA